MNTPQLMQSKAMLLRGVDTLPGVLQFAGGRLRYSAHERGTLGKGQLQKLEQDCGQPGLAEALLKESPTLVFDVPLAEVGVKFPWYYFSGGCKLKVQGVEYRLSFGGGLQFSESIGSPDDLDFIDSVKGTGEQIVGNLKEVGQMRHVGKAWRKVLEA